MKLYSYLSHIQLEELEEEKRAIRMIATGINEDINQDHDDNEVEDIRSKDCFRKIHRRLCENTLLGFNKYYPRRSMNSITKYKKQHGEAERFTL